MVTDNKDYKLDSIELINGCADTFDIELDNNRPLSEQLYHILLDYLKELKQEYKNSVPELAKLNLKNL